MHTKTAALYSFAQLALLIVIGLCAVTQTADAHVAQITVNTVESPTFGGQSFGAVGTYTRISGTFTGKLDPRDPHNAVIVDIDKAPRDAHGLVTYTADFQILKPTNLGQGNHRIVLELPNRGGALILGTLNDSPAGNTTLSAGSPGDGFLMNEGYTVVEVGWDLTAPQGGAQFGITLPIATNRNGSPITGPATEELVVDFTSAAASLPLTYPTASADASGASLTVRENYDDTPIPIPSAALPGLDWQYLDAQHVQLTLNGVPVPFGAPGTYSPTALYELSYVAQNPRVVGIGFASVRDFATFLRDAKADELGTANPLAGDVRKIYTFCLSQPCRTTRDFVLWGFNEAEIPDASMPHKGWGDPSWWDHFWQHGGEHHERVFDGMLNWLGGGDGIFMNYRFAQPTRTHRQHIARWTPEFQFPFADVSLYDPVTGKSGGRLVTCERTNTCPQIFEVNSENEFWAKGGSMLVTDGQGHDLDLARTPQVRYYLLSSLEHSAGSVSVSLNAATTPGICQQPSNPMVGNVVLRALLVDLDQWVSRDTSPLPMQCRALRMAPSSPHCLRRLLVSRAFRAWSTTESITRVTCGTSALDSTMASYRCCRPSCSVRLIKSTYPRPMRTAMILPACVSPMCRCPLRLTPAGGCAPRTPDSRSPSSTDVMRPASEFPSPRPQRPDSQAAPTRAIHGCPLPSVIRAVLTT